MANIFKENKAVNEHPNRNNFDLSKKSNVSLKFGTLYPVYCQPVVPGDSFDINVAYNLKLMPVVFPVQTKMRAHMHFFYVRNKNLWTNWENWISNLPNATQSLTPHPYIDIPDSAFKSGSIHDFLGVPTSVVSNNDISYNYDMGVFFDEDSQSYWLEIGQFVKHADIVANIINGTTITPSTTYTSDFCYIYPTTGYELPDGYLNSDFTLRFQYTDFVGNIGGLSTTPSGLFQIAFRYKTGPNTHATTSRFLSIVSPITVGDYILYQGTGLSDQIDSILANYTEPDQIKFYFRPLMKLDYAPLGEADGSFIYCDDKPIAVHFAVSKGFEQYSNLGIDLYSRHLRINALPYRAYESIYWAYYNNNVVSPMTINGDVQYNRYNTNLGDGADSTNYHLFQRNYELDFLTSALPSPQQGVAPLVGMTALGDVTIEDENGITTAHAEIDNDGTITKVVLTSPAASVEHARTAMNIAASGMSINDFRQTNALQRVLETNIRKGYRYMDFIAGHFGKEPEYRELDMPEFIGGFSRDVNVSTVVSQADTLGDDSGKSLGSYGGFAQVVGGTNHAIRHYCDDYGFIIGILSVVPTPCYSQLLPKHMIAPDNFLDYYFPEFSQSGLMPITYKEVAPIQSYLDSLTDNTKSLEDTFGYQRPNYDMVSAVDEVHGEFRGALRDYVINRIFSTRPELGRSFLQINPSEINDIFVNTNPDDDTIIGEIGFAVHAKRPVPRVVIPNLGR